MYYTGDCFFLAESSFLGDPLPCEIVAPSYALWFYVNLTSLVFLLCVNIVPYLGGDLEWPDLRVLSSVQTLERLFCWEALRLPKEVTWSASLGLLSACGQSRS
ncbi:hypothetical protein FGO68_gene17395 [Halteria grandinella]|uniref:Uncharacterized protein n=1 Tax=Halteria grandinella TaxID=5974 RepID=A0A8J8NYU1_HALGN|nr:hypothetical protein FGO68_gene17395 [Halteria grandinella]